MVQTTRSGARMVRANGVDLCVETFGDPTDHPVLLISGGASSMMFWTGEFCTSLAGADRFVLRYDHRDTGRSVHYPAGAPEYTMNDLMADAVGIIDAFGLGRVHVVGISMGGDIALQLGLRHADRVASLTLLSTSLAGPGGGDGLPGMTDELKEYFATAATPDWTDRSAVLDSAIAFEHALRGSLPYDEAAARAGYTVEFDRTNDLAAAQANHFILPSAGRWDADASAISAPTLVIHGTEDPLLPFEHGEALARTIPGARLLPLERVGHEMPPPTWGTVVAAIVEHTA